MPTTVEGTAARSLSTVGREIIYMLLAPRLRPPGAQRTPAMPDIADGNGVRATARLTGVNRNTMVRYSRLPGDQARQLHDELVAPSPSGRWGSARRVVRPPSITRRRLACASGGTTVVP
jgi:hypothetical protein